VGQGPLGAQALENVFQRTVAAATVAAVVVEPVLGEGGFVAPLPSGIGWNVNDRSRQIS